MTYQAVAPQPDWPTCVTLGCIGVRAAGEQSCLAHLKPGSRKMFLAALEPGSTLDLRGTPIDSDLLDQVLTALKPADGPPTLGITRFEWARFNGDAQFGGVRFTRDAWFDDARFSATASFDEAQFSEAVWFVRVQFIDATRFQATKFNGYARFNHTQFGGASCFNQTQFNADAWLDKARFLQPAEFAGSRFSGTASFDKVQFKQDARLQKTRFQKDASFRRAQFGGTASFDEAQFGGGAWFDGTEFKGLAWFDKTQFRNAVRFHKTQFSKDALFAGTRFSGTARFHGTLFSDAARFHRAQFSWDAEFHGTQFCGVAWYGDAQFERTGSFRPMLAMSSLILDGATFAQSLTLEATASGVSCVGTRFAEAATLSLRYADVVLDGAVFAKPSTIAFAPDALKYFDADTGKEVETFHEGPVANVKGGRSPQPRLLSLRRVDVATLTLSDLDLAACLFHSAHHLDELRIEGDRPFAETPGTWLLYLGRWRMPVWRRWSRRHTLAEEHHWRSEPLSEPRPVRWPWLRRPGWHGPASQTPMWVAQRTGQRVQQLKPDRLAVLYRALRKAQEDSKDEPGAADFYYGEMEMRRRNLGRPLAERAILWLYWLVSGYGLRGLRALTCLAAVIVGLAGLLQAIGFNGGDPSFRDALIYAAQTTISIASGNEALAENTSWAGEVLRIVLRLAGPLLLGLALLSVRNRVKR
jgi:hypothetical protein